MPVLCAQVVRRPFYVCLLGFGEGNCGVDPLAPRLLGMAGLGGQQAAGVACGMACCQGDLISLDMWAYLVGGTHF